MTVTTPSTAVAIVQPTFAGAERLALAGFLAGYRGLTRDAYTLDLRQFAGWCQARSLPLFSASPPPSTPMFTSPPATTSAPSGSKPMPPDTAMPGQ